MDLDTTVKKIKSLEIQGASNIAKAAVKALSSHASAIKTKNPSSFIKGLEQGKKKLFMTRPTEPAMRNMLNYILFNVKRLKSEDVKELEKAIKKTAKYLINLYEKEKVDLVNSGNKIVSKKPIVYTHCHSSVVESIIISCKKNKVKVSNTETRPKMQGRITAKKLSKAGIAVTHFVDSAAGYAIMDSKIMLIGADAITPKGVYNKVGSALFAKIAYDFKVPVYVCATSWKIDPDTFKRKGEVIEERASSEVWKKAPKGVKIRNPAFDIVNPKHIKGVISELGVFKYKKFIKTARKRKPWLFS